MVKLTHSAFADHFSAKTRRALLAKGIAIIGITAIPDMSTSMPWANATTGYQLNDNGTGRVRSYLEVVALAEGGAV